MEAIKEFIDAHQEVYIERLRESVEIPSVSGEPERRPEVERMGMWLHEWILRLGGKSEIHELGSQTHSSGVELKLPPIIAAQVGEDPAKKTLLVYGHYDVQPAEKSDGWDTEPFELVEKDGKLWGRGSTDDKAPILGWLWVIEAHQKLGLELPVNIKMIFEGMEESGSIGLDEWVMGQRGKFLEGVDFVCISDNYWLGTEKPCITYGLRGLAYFFLEIEGGTKDLHSGLFGGSVNEAMIDLSHLFSKLVDTHGNILIPGVLDSVLPVTAEERKLYEPIDFDLEKFKVDAGVDHLIHNTKEDTLMSRWRFPSLSIHGVEGAFYGGGGKTVIPRKVIGKFSIRLVPDQDPEEIIRLTKAYVEEEFAKLQSGNRLRVSTEHPGRPWLADRGNPNYVAAQKAVENVYGVTPDFTREGGSIPVALVFEEATEKSVLLLPMGSSDDGAHSQNEKINRRNYIEGIKLLACYMHELALGSSA